MADRKTSSPKATEEMNGAWRELPWRKLEKHVYRMQKRIYRASQRGNTTTSREAAKVAPEIGSSTAVGSATSDAGQPGKEDGRSRRGQIRPSQRTLSHGQSSFTRNTGNTANIHNLYAGCGYPSQEKPSNGHLEYQP